MSITAAGEATSPRTLHRVGTALVLLVCTSLFMVAGTNAQPASAKIDTAYLERMLKTVPKSAAGVGSVVGGTLTAGGLASTAAAAVAGYFVFDLSFDATTAGLNYVFTDPEVGGAPDPTLATTYQQVCWSSSTGGVCVEDPAYQYDGLSLYVGYSVTAHSLVLTSPGAPGTNAAAVTSIRLETGGSTLAWGDAGWTASGQVICGTSPTDPDTGTFINAAVTYPSGIARLEYPACAAGRVPTFYRQYRSGTPLDPALNSWRPVGTPATGEPPQHKWRSTVTCPGGSTFTTYSPTFIESNPAPIVPAGCADGALPTALTVHEGDETGAGGTQVIDWEADPAQPFAECLPGGNQHPCSLSLYKITPAGPKDCVGATIDCTSYDPETSLDTEYLCHWGNYTAPLDDCAPLVLAITGPSPGDPLDPADPVPGTIGAGTTVNNPDGSTTHTQTQTMPDGTTRTVTTTTYPDGRKVITTQPLNPDGTPNGAPSVVNIPAPGTGEQTDSPDGNCMDGAFGFNPLSWVYTPVKCALQWAFVPPPGSIEASFGGIGDAWDGTAIGTFGGMLGDVFGPIGDLDDLESDGCLGPLVTLPLPVGPDLSIRPLNVCNELAQYVLGFWMPAASAGIYLATFFGIYHGFGRALGLSTPVVRAKGA